MRRKITLHILGILLVTLCATTTKATIYTAVQSGPLFMPSTWMNGMIPPATLSGDTIIVSTGVTLDIGRRIFWLNNANDYIDVHTSGKMVTNDSGQIRAVKGRVNNDGEIDIFLMSISGNRVVSPMTTSIRVKELELDSSQINDVAMLYVHDAMRVYDNNIISGNSQIQVSAGGDTTLVSMLGSSGASITTQGSGMIDLTRTYDLHYFGTRYTTGIESRGSGLHDLTIGIRNVLLIVTHLVQTSDIRLSGRLSLNDGRLFLGGHNLIFDTTASFAQVGGEIYGSPFSSVHIHSMDMKQGLVFDSTSKIIDTLNISLAGDNSMVTISSDVIVRGNLTLNKGKLYTEGNELYLIPVATLTGGGMESYVISDTGGSLSMSVGAADTVLYPIGTVDKYAPASIASNGVNYSGFGMNVQSGVLAEGDEGRDLAQDQSLVNATWNMVYNGAANVDVDVEVFWDTSMEVNGFNRDRSYIATYDDTGWGLTLYYMANTAMNGMYSQMRNNVNKIAPLAVLDEATNLTVANVENTELKIYPNPAEHILYISGVEASADVNIYSLTGQQVLHTVVDQNRERINISALPAGSYVIVVDSNGDTVKQQFSKL